MSIITVLQVAIAISNKGREDVYLLCQNDQLASQVRQHLENNNNNNSSTAHHTIHVDICPSNDTWVRDTGPTFCWETTTNELVGLDWNFNAYGGPEEGCYWPCTLDCKVATRICEIISSSPIRSCRIPIILEGGSIHTDGEGTLLTTEECLLNPNRNPQLDKKEIEKILKKALGVQTIIWLPHGLDADDDTNGHVDNFCCFVRPGHVVLAWTDDETNDPENYTRCRAAQSVLSSCRDAKGRTIQVHKLLLPPPIVSSLCVCVLLVLFV